MLRVQRFFKASFFLVLLAPIRFGGGFLVKDAASQCAEDQQDSSTSGKFLTQRIYTPSLHAINFFAICVGSQQFPEVSSSYWTHKGDFDTFNRFNIGDCGTVFGGKCCLADPAPGENTCDFTKIAKCTAWTSPEDPLEISCSSGVLNVIVEVRPFVMEDEGHLYFADFDFATASTQPDGSIRFSSLKAQNNLILNSAVAIHPNALREPPASCGQCLEIFSGISAVETCATAMGNSACAQDLIVDNTLSCLPPDTICDIAIDNLLEEGFEEEKSACSGCTDDGTSVTIECSYDYCLECDPMTGVCATQSSVYTFDSAVLGAQEIGSVEIWSAIRSFEYCMHLTEAFETTFCEKATFDLTTVSFSATLGGESCESSERVSCGGGEDAVFAHYMDCSNLEGGLSFGQCDEIQNDIIPSDSVYYVIEEALGGRILMFETCYDPNAEACTSLELTSGSDCNTDSNTVSPSSPPTGGPTLSPSSPPTGGPTVSPSSPPTGRLTVSPSSPQTGGYKFRFEYMAAFAAAPALVWL